MNKGTKIALIVLAVLSLACFAGIWSIFSNVQGELADQKEEAQTAANEIAILVASRWRYESFELRTSPQFERDDERLAAWEEQFGSLTSVAMAVESLTIDDSNADVPVLTVQAAGDAFFDKGAGRIEMTLTREPRNSWLLERIDVKPLP